MSPDRTPSLADRWARWRNGLISKPDFQAWATRLPFTRAIARRKASETFDLVAGFVYSQVVAACGETGLLHAAAETPQTPEAFAGTSGLPVQGAERLLKAAAAIDLLRCQRDGRFAIGEAGAALLGNPSVFAMIRHHRAFYADLEDPVALLRARRDDTALAQFWAYSPSAGSAAAAAYSDLMAQTQALIAENVLSSYRFARHRHLMDLGGGLGAFITAAARRHPHLKLTLVDLPPVISLARERLGTSSIASRLTIESCDIFNDKLPAGADLVTLIRVVHDHDDGPVMRLLRSIRDCLSPGGRLLIGEPMAGADAAGRMGDAYFGLYLWAMGRGRPRTAAELSRMLQDAGFRAVQRLKTRQPLLVSVLVAKTN